ncbi:hypothetical protein POJ06DRAFT_64287 [Lipomyces tetrasporus]|uniref:Uncharacterized protein n=1 Tax=Lipomyces tetrasporus TaxID=54092 RepID=A0AAD7VVN3_9ASCO|nr:uncharacterized protein POJ06DRAFT_64287 [Lipomyces tetrasporus]KAJ8103149.1 hypothetical protein POJ06DRAFT_64287 [Lipomyces tetrasporus]
MESATLLRDLLRDTSVPVTSTSSTSSASSSTSSTNLTSVTLGGIAMPDLIRADTATMSSHSQLQERQSMFLPRYESDQVSGPSQSPTHHHSQPQSSQPISQQSAGRQGPVLRRAQSRYFEGFNNSQTQTQSGSAIDVGSLSNGLSGLNITNGPLPSHSQLHHQMSQQFDSYDGGAGSAFQDPRSDGLRHDSSSMSRGYHQLYHQTSSEYVWKSMNQATRPRSWFESIPTFPQQQEYLPQPRMPFLNAGPYSTSPSSNGYSPSKSETVISESSKPVYSSSPQNRLQSRISQMSFSSTSSQQGPQPSQPQQEQEDDLIPTAIVIKNIPFAIKKEQLLELMLNLGLTLPYAFNYHFDNGVFRGLAFANFATAEDTASVIQTLNGHELAGRKLRVEYKKMLPAADRERIEREKRGKRGQLEEQHRTSYAQLSKTTMGNGTSGGGDISPTSVNARMDLDLNDPETLNFYSEILLFRDDSSREELVFGGNLTPLQRRNVHLLAHTMGLVHISRGEGDMREVVVSRRPQPHAQSMLMYANRTSGIPEEYAGSNVDNRLLRGAQSFADIRSTARIGTQYPSTWNSNMSSASTLYGQSLRTPQA